MDGGLFADVLQDTPWSVCTPQSPMAMGMAMGFSSVQLEDDFMFPHVTENFFNLETPKHELQTGLDDLLLDESHFSHSSISSSSSPLSWDYFESSSSSSSSTSSSTEPPEPQPQPQPQQRLEDSVSVINNPQLQLDLQIRTKDSVISASSDHTAARKNSQLTVGMLSSHPKLAAFPTDPPTPFAFLSHSSEKGALLTTEYILSVYSPHFPHASKETAHTLNFSIPKPYKICSRCAKGIQHEISSLHFRAEVADQLTEQFFWVQSLNGETERYTEDSNYKHVQMAFSENDQYRLFFPCACEHQTNKSSGRHRVVNIRIQLTAADGGIVASNQLHVSVSGSPARNFLRFFKLPHHNLRQFLDTEHAPLSSTATGGGGVCGKRKTIRKTKTNQQQQKQKLLKFKSNFLELLEITSSLNSADKGVVQNSVALACSGSLQQAQNLLTSIF